MKYEVKVHFLTSDNEFEEKTKTMTYDYQEGRPSLEMKGNSLEMKYLVKGESVEKAGTLFAYDEADELLDKTAVALPQTLPIRPLAKEYELMVGEASTTAEVPNSVSAAYWRTEDSVFIQISNPKDLPLWYHLYYQNREIKHGQTDSLHLALKARGNKPYLLVLQYVWMGKAHSQSYGITLPKRALTVELEHPKRIYPGQEVEMAVTVTNAKEQPVPKVGLTAYGLTTKFKGYSAPKVPSFERNPRYAKSYREFSYKELEKAPHGKLLKRHYWDKAQSLDSIAWFQFLYPENGIYTASMPLPDSSAQVAPFVVDSGRMEPVHIIYLDKIPVYYRNINISQPYAVHVDTGYHRVAMRTRNQLIILDSVYFKGGEKLIISADVLRSHPQKKVKKMPSSLEPYEVKTLARRMMWLKPTTRSNPANYYTYLRQGSRVFWLKNDFYSYSRNNLMLGPFLRDTLNFVKPEAFSASLSFESGFVYDFSPGLVKLYDRDLPKHLWLKQNGKVDDIYDRAIREADILAAWEKANRPTNLNDLLYDGPNRTTYGYGKLVIGLPDSLRSMIFRQLLFKKGTPDFLRIYPSDTRSIHELDSGRYELLIFTKDTAHYFLLQLEVQVNGINFYRYDSLAPMQLTEAQKRLFELVNGGKDRLDSLRKARQSIKATYHKAYPQAAAKGWKVIRGKVEDLEEGKGLEGVAVVIIGTTIGVLTDEKGYFKLNAPTNGILLFSYVGMKSREEFVRGRDRVVVKMEEDATQVDEVMIVSYKIPQFERDRIPSAQLSGQVVGMGMRRARSDATVYYVDGMKIRGASSVITSATPFLVIDGVIHTGGLPGEFGDLSGGIIKSATVLQGDEATALYGARAANGAIIITTNRAVSSHLLAAQSAAPEESAANAVGSSLRRNFKDYAFWQPDLLTDAQGQVRFTVTFPDDVTKWRAFALAYGQKRSGQAESFLRSYKELMAQVATPRFLVQGDSAHVITKALNYGPDSQSVNLSFQVGDRLLEEREASVKDAVIDTFVVSPTTLDSLMLTYRLEKADGYFDGEERKIPVYPVGTRETIGQFHALHEDTVMTLSFDPDKGPVKVHARADVLEVMLEEIESLRKYAYDCNEQASSKLLALILKKRICEHLKEPFTHDNHVKKLIRRLSKAQNEDGLWGWWPSGDGQLWITEHVLTALLAAEREGYETDYHKESLESRFLFELEGRKRNELLTSFRLLHHFDPDFSRKKDLDQLVADTSFSFYQHLQILQLCQLYKVPYSLDTLFQTEKQTILGNAYWGTPRRWLGNNAIQTTLLAHQLLTADSAGSHKALLTRINAYFLERRHNGRWRNTYESAQILNAILPSLLEGRDKDDLLALQFEGALSTKVVDFPFEAEISPEDTLWVSKGGSLPVYLTAYQQFHNYTPKAVTKDFEVKTWFEDEKGESNQHLSPGKKATLRIKVVVHRASDYVMIEVPIPAGCTYSSKPKAHWRNKEVHREYFRDHTSIFCQRLEEGTYEFSIPLLARYGGSYTLNPAKTEEMYFPVFFGRNEGRKVQVRK